ncbi:MULTISPECIES: universal stress protein [Niastella]|uniref:Universal stress protein n=1 Tax=Niastella soli TaxID=2821487 RepID=A0ABS3YW57_9BACT|nr:universal stress protein [Niastella soli]MBO9201973.1 universal stress protein [Niastella soli]
MKKVMIAIDAQKVNMKVLDFACYIARLTHSRLTGVFLDDAQILETMIKEPIYREAKFAPAVKKMARSIDENIHLFKEACANREINCSVYFENNNPLVEIIKQTRFAELLIVDPEMSFKQKKEEIPSGFIKEVLAKSECPVVLAPFDFHTIDEIILAYDGSAASVYAIKQFTYLFPELSARTITVLEVNEAGDSLFNEKGKITELLELHYQNIKFQLLQGKAADELFGHLLGKKNVFVVMGAFERAKLARLFSHSTAELIIKAINVPVFVAHHK